MNELRAAVAAKWREIAPSIGDAFRKLGLSSAYGVLIAATFLPLAQLYSADRNVLLIWLASTLGTIGTGLLTNFVQKVFDKGLSPAELEKLARADPDIQRVVDAIVAATGS